MTKNITSAISTACVHPGVYSEYGFKSVKGSFSFWKAITELFLPPSINMRHPVECSKNNNNNNNNNNNRITEGINMDKPLAGTNCSNSKKTYRQTLPSFIVYRIPAQSMEPKLKTVYIPIHVLIHIAAFT